MAKSKTKKRKNKKDPNPVVYIAILCFVAGVVVTLAAVKYLNLFSPTDRKPQISVAEAPPPEGGKPDQVPDLTVPAARLALVIDDMGGNIGRLRDLLEIEAPITIAVLPHLKYSEATAFEAYSSGHEVIMHLPMEPQDTSNDPGSGALMVTMAPDEIRSKIEDDLKTVPYAIGVNNHMGSKFTENEPGMRTALEVVRSKGLFFLDSRTTSRSVGIRLAGELGMSFAGRNVFLDNTREDAYIKGQLLEAVELAKKNGNAIAIGHPYPETISALKDVLPGLERDGVAVVRLSEVLEGPGTDSLRASGKRAKRPLKER